MKNSLRMLLDRLSSRSDLDAVVSGLRQLSRRFDDSVVMHAQMLSKMCHRAAPETPLADVEFKAFSQFGDDGILQFLVHHVGILPRERVFVEFGVETYREANTRLLLVKDYWRGLVLDGSESHVRSIRDDEVSWRYDLTATAAWIDRDNINALIGDNGFSGEIGLVSVDVDGNDYWILEALEVVRPIILVTEYNGIFGPTEAVSVPYDPNFHRLKAHFSGQYWGASAVALEYLARRKGYALVGSNRAGNNLFFVREDRLGKLPRRSVAEAFVVPGYRDSRSESGVLTFLSGDQRIKLIAELPLTDVRTGETRLGRDFGLSNGL